MNKAALEAKVNAIIPHPEFAITDQDFDVFQELMKGVTLGEDINEAAIAFIVTGV